MIGIILIGLTSFINQSQSYVEIEMRVESDDFIQLFSSSKDGTLFFSEEQALWKIVKEGEFQKIRWQLVDTLIYDRFRIDIATRKEHEIDVRAITLHVNGDYFQFNGIEILKFFTPNIFLQLNECDSNILKFNSVIVAGMMNGMLKMEDYLSNLKSKLNTKLAITLSNKNDCILQAKIIDANGKTKRVNYCLSANKDTTIDLFFSLESPPSDIIIAPSITNENLISISEIRLDYKYKTVVWSNNSIFNQFNWNTEYYAIENENEVFFVKTKIKNKLHSFELTKNNVEFPIDRLIRIFRQIVIFTFVGFILYLINNRAFQMKIGLIDHRKRFIKKV